MKKITVPAVTYDPDFSFLNPHPVMVYKNPSKSLRGNLQIKAAFGELNGMVVNKDSVYIWKRELATHNDVKKQFDDGEYTFEAFKVNAYEQVKAVGSDVTDEQLMKYPAIQRMMRF